jgi:hypothetical protein
VYSYAVDHLRGPAREALATLAAKLPAAPTRVLVKDDSEGRPTVTQPADTLLVFVSLYYDDATRYKPGYLVDRMLDGGGVPPCGSPSGSPDTRHQAARLVAGAWLQDQDLPPADSTGKDPVLAPAREALAVLRALPADEQRARVAALRDAERTCAEGDRLALLTGSRP